MEILPNAINVNIGELPSMGIQNKGKSQIHTLIHQTGVRHRKWKTLLRKYSGTKKYNNTSSHF